MSAGRSRGQPSTLLLALSSMTTAATSLSLSHSRSDALFRAPSRRAPCLLLASLLLSAYASPAVSQQPPTSKVNVTVERSGGDARAEDEDGQLSPREEMLKNVEIKRRELSYQENLAKAKEGAQLGAEIYADFSRHKALGAAELKKLSRVEKLARSIREESGGGDDGSELKDPPADLEAALKRLAYLSEELCKEVEKTPRHVISAAVIGDANQLITLVRHIRTLGS